MIPSITPTAYKRRAAITMLDFSSGALFFSKAYTPVANNTYRVALSITNVADWVIGGLTGFRPSNQIRVAFGAALLSGGGWAISLASVGVQDEDEDTIGTPAPLTFRGQPGFSIGQQEGIWSDWANLHIADKSKAISVSYQHVSGQLYSRWTNAEWWYMSGNQVFTAQPSGANQYSSENFSMGVLYVQTR